MPSGVFSCFPKCFFRGKDPRKTFSGLWKIMSPRLLVEILEKMLCGKGKNVIKFVEIKTRQNICVVLFL